MISDAQLAAELQKYGVYFLANHMGNYSPKLSPETLIATLASHPQARFRLALIPLFLTQSNLSKSIDHATSLLDAPSEVTLACYYTAAQLLQQKYHDRLTRILGVQPTLPNVFEEWLHLEGATPDNRLHALANQQAKLTNRFVNWYGTYHHAFNRFIKSQQALTQYKHT